MPADKMIAAEAGDPQFNEVLAQKAQDVARAHQAVADAQDNRTRAAINLTDAESKLSASVDGQAQALGAVQDEINSLAQQGLDVSALVIALSEATGTSLLGNISPGQVAEGQNGPPKALKTLGPPQGASASSGGATVNITQNVATVSGATAAQISAELASSVRTTVAPKLQRILDAEP